jgi:hypothetical protein
MKALHTIWQYETIPDPNINMVHFSMINTKLSNLISSNFGFKCSILFKFWTTITLWATFLNPYWSKFSLVYCSLSAQIPFFFCGNYFKKILTHYRFISKVLFLSAEYVDFHWQKPVASLYYSRSQSPHNGKCHSRTSGQSRMKCGV